MPKETPTNPKQRRASLCALYALGATFLSTLVLSVMVSMRRGAEEDLLTLTLCQTFGFSIMMFVAIRVHAPEASVRGVLGIRALPIRAVILSAVSGAGIYPLASKLGDLVHRRFPESEEIQALALRVTRDETWGDKSRLFVCLVLILPAVFELFFRGLLWNLLHAETGSPKRNAWGPALVTLLLYLLYVSGESFRALPVQLLLGVCVTLLRVSSSSASAPWLAHAAFFAAPFGLMLARLPEGSLSWPIAAASAVASCIALGLSWLFPLPTNEPAFPQESD
jgi:hypothetical protein